MKENGRSRTRIHFRRKRSRCLDWRAHYLVGRLFRVILCIILVFVVLFIFTIPSFHFICVHVSQDMSLSRIYCIFVVLQNIVNEIITKV